jgi:hypothetical protein
MMGFALRWLASGFIASLIALAVLRLLPTYPWALDVIAVPTIAALFNIALSWKDGSDARGLAMVLGLSFVLMMAGLTLFLPRAWAPWF